MEVCSSSGAQIPIALAARPAPHFRDFVPWRLWDAGQLSLRSVSLLPASKNQHSLGQSVVIENVSGATGSIAVGRVVRSSPDGYTSRQKIHWQRHPIFLQWMQLDSPAFTWLYGTDCRRRRERRRMLSASVVDALADSSVRARLAELAQEIPAQCTKGCHKC
ncbi:MAG: hypothetical protein JO283_04150 [Bradyrhizobium sp.]|nr:hypothetical protein [Bradyrhizobium sp.]